MLRLWEVYCAGDRHTYPLLSLCNFGAQAPDGFAVRSSSLVFYFVVQDVVEIIQEYFIRLQVRSQEKAGAVARYVRLHAVDEQERSRLRILRWSLCSQVTGSHVHVFCCTAVPVINYRRVQRQLCTFSLFVLSIDVSTTKRQHTKTI